jgi:hypothetical protein
VAGVHPAVPALLPDASSVGIEPDGLAGRAAQLATWRDWPVLRRACAGGTWEARDIPPAVATWLDDGAFSRWALGAYPDLAELWATVADLLPRSLAVAVAKTLLASGVAP